MILFGKKDQPSRNAYAVVTGAGSGIGRSFAVELAKRGGSIVCADINLEAAKETVKLIEQLGRKAFAVRKAHLARSAHREHATFLRHRRRLKNNATRNQTGIVPNANNNRTSNPKLGDI